MVDKEEIVNRSDDKIRFSFESIKKSRQGKVERNWGNYTVLEEGKGYKIKIIEVNPGHRLSLQKHLHRSEHWVVLSGIAKVTNGGGEKIIHINESTYILKNMVHRLENPGRIPLKIIEIQNGEYLEEDDIERFDDDYGRTNEEASGGDLK